MSYPQSMVLAILSIVGVVSVAALLWFAKVQVGVVLHKIGEIQPPDTPPADPNYATTQERLGALEGDYGVLLVKMHTLTKAVADGIDHVDRNEKRVRGIVTGAKRRFEAEGYVDPGVEAEADTLPRGDASYGPEERVQPVSDDVEPAPSPLQGVPGNLPPGFLDGVS